MSNVRIQTVHNVSIDFEVASIGERIVAQILDNVIRAGYAIIIFSMFQAGDVRSSDAMILMVLMIVLPIMLYTPVMEYFLEGQTIGKRAMRIKVLRADGGQPGIGAYLLRWLLAAIEISMFSGIPAILIIAINGKGQRLGDMAAGTMVVKNKYRDHFEDTVYMRDEEEYRPVFGAEVLRLSDKDLGVLKAILQVIDGRQAMPHNIADMLLKAKANVERVMEVSSSEAPEPFIRQVLKDYNHYSNQ